MPTGNPGWALLKEARMRAGLTQRQLADRAGVPQSTVSVYERGVRQPTLPTLERLLRAAGFVLRTDLAPIGPDLQRNGRVLKELLELADRIPPGRRRPLTYPRLPSATVQP